MKSEETKADDNVINPGDVPPWPYADEDTKKGDAAKLAEAAWTQSNGSMVAYQQLAADHAAGRLDLLDLKASQPEPTPRRRAPSAPASTLPGNIVGTNELIADNVRRSEADRVVHGQNIQGPAPVARAAAERDEARASQVRAAGEAAMRAAHTATDVAAREVRVPSGARAAGAAGAAPSGSTEGHATDGRKTSG